MRIVKRPYVDIEDAEHVRITEDLVYMNAYIEETENGILVYLPGLKKCDITKEEVDK